MLRWVRVLDILQRATQVRTTRGTPTEVRVPLVVGELVAGYELWFETSWCIVSFAKRWSCWIAALRWVPLCLLLRLQEEYLSLDQYSLEFRFLVTTPCKVFDLLHELDSYGFRYFSTLLDIGKLRWMRPGLDRHECNTETIVTLMLLSLGTIVKYS